MAENKVATPKEIHAYLDKYVIGQDEAKKILSVAVYNHYKRIYYNNTCSGMKIKKSNILLLGSTGCGKTLLCETVAKLLKVPCFIQDTTKITASGYVGTDVEDCIGGLYRTSGENIGQTEIGIVVLDEVDKMAKKSAGPSITRDVSGECVQQSLLKIVDGDKVGIQPAGGRKHPQQELVYINTSNILFIATGAFVGMEDIIKKRTNGRTTIGYTSNNIKQEDNNENILSNIQSEDLIEYGMIPEFVGRFPILTHVNPIDVEAMKRIITEPEDSIVNQYKQLLLMDGITLKFEKDAIELIAETAVKSQTGARGLRNIIETIMLDIMYDAPDMEEKQINITKKFVEEKLGMKVAENKNKKKKKAA